jgi:hypothetical protein
MNTFQQEIEPGIHLIINDAAVLACLAFNNQLAAMREADEYGVGRAFCGWATAGAFFCAAHFYGYDSEVDNGYALLIVSRDHFTREQAAEIIQAWIDCGRDFTRPSYFRALTGADPAVN